MSHRILYVIRHLDTGLHKIGITNDWSRRQRELEVGTKTAPVHVVRVNDARQIERFLHRRFRANRMPQSEWFHLSDIQLEFVRTTVLKARDDHQHQGQPSAAPPTPPSAKAEPQPALARRPEAERTQTPTTAQNTQQPAGRPDWVDEGLDAIGAISFATIALLVLLSPLFIWMNSAEKKAEQQRAEIKVQAQEAELLSELQEQNKQAVLDQLKKAEDAAAQQAAIEQAALQEEKETLKRYAWTFRTAEAYDCRFYAWSQRAGDPLVHLSAFSALPDAEASDALKCHQLTSTFSGSFIGKDAAFVRDKLLAERGQLPPPEKRYGSNTVYRLDWPVAQ